MDFKQEPPLGLSAKFPRARFSIRLSILSIVLILLLGVSSVIIGVNYFATNSILVASAKDSLFQSGGRIAEQIRGYLQPLNSNILTAYRMFNQGVADPREADFSRFLYGLIIDNENLTAAYWADVNGSTIWLNRSPKGFFLETLLRDKSGKVTKFTKTELDEYGSVISEENLSGPIFDSRTRPWYKQAELKKDLIWVIYRFFQVTDQPAQLGVTSAFPVYDSAGVLQAVFGIDMLLGAINTYVQNIKLTENSFIFVVDLAGGLVAAHTGRGAMLLDSTPEITDFEKPWVKKSFDIFLQKRESPFVYSYDSEHYIAAYEKISGVKSDEPWYIAIVTPIDDIIAPLLKNVLFGSLLTGIALLFGIIMASVFSSSLSRPIKKLAKDADLICQLQLESVKQLYSRIQEIANMADSFTKMKNALYSFQRYMPIALVKKLIISNKVATVGGESKELTLLFTDIKDFTQLSEGFEPEALMRYLSEYFQTITKVIIEMNGTVDKYVGDGVMAFWGAPISDNDHVLHACQAAIQARDVLQQLNLKWRQENKPEVFTRFGLSCGRVIVGNVGSDDRLSYTSLGDQVNLASRLEELNKVYGTAIMVSEFVYEKVKDKFKFRLLDRVAVRGKKQGVCVYELLGELDFKPDLELERYNSEFSHAFSSYEYGDWQTALHLFAELNKQYPDDKVVKILMDRCSVFIANPPADWNGVWVMEGK